MAELVERVKFESMQGKVQDVKLYSTLEEVSGQGVLLCVMSDNLIPVEQQKFDGWIAYQGAVVTITQGISVPEWATTEATRVQTSGGTGQEKYFTGINILPVRGTAGVTSVYIKNMGTTTVQLRANGMGYSQIIRPNEITHAVVETKYNGSGYAQIAVVPVNNLDSTNVVVYKPEIRIASNCYMKYGEVTDVHATAARVNRYENLIPPGKRKFEGWTVYQGAVATVTQGISVPEWNTNEATRVQTSGGTSVTKYLIGFGIQEAGIICHRKVYIKNINTTDLYVAGNAIFPTITVKPNELIYVNTAGIGTGAADMQIHFKASSADGTIDIVVYKPELYYSDDLNKDWAILSQAEVPYGQMAYTTSGTYTFTVPSGVAKVRVTGISAVGVPLADVKRDTSFGNYFTVKAGNSNSPTPINGIAHGSQPNLADAYLPKYGHDLSSSTAYILDAPYGRRYIHGQSLYPPGGVVTHFTGTGGKDIKTISVTPNESIAVTIGENIGKPLTIHNGAMLIEWGGDIK